MAKHIARKRFGQNFLADDKIIEQIIKTIAAKKNDNILEIGAGQGALTLPLLLRLERLNVIEIDRDLVKLLNSFKHKNLTVHQADVLKFDLSKIPAPMRIVGNLPYNISSPILLHFLAHRDKIIDMTFMLQKQVVERITAKNGSKIYGRLSVILQAFFEMEMVFTVPPEAFSPAPKVDSAIIYLKPLKKPLAKNIYLLQKIVKAAFSKRRKTLRNCLKSLLIQEQTSIELSQRAEMLSVADFVKLTNDYEKTL
ncbi:MAG: 16S rRNA (adenine(1518)-N(6)/adenine(1519)-N(6))-dimethyltransferase RsmA [Candidatus Thioglobus sp.]|nr:16S rRNA (adenine(1518)-N(6)/adenine(1519)-N(6))-dimethyltransferase RsmA [Candidatus Thioglobus sp.]